MRIKNLLKKILNHPFLATQKLKIARNILISDNTPQFLKGLVYRSQNHLPRKKVVTKIKIGSGVEAIYELDLSSYGDRKIFYDVYEPATINFYEQIVKSKRIVWDIGSNIGFYVSMAGIILKGKGEIFAFEPVPINFNALKKMLNSLILHYLLGMEKLKFIFLILIGLLLLLV